MNRRPRNSGAFCFFGPPHAPCKASPKTSLKTGATGMQGRTAQIEALEAQLAALKAAEERHLRAPEDGPLVHRHAAAVRRADDAPACRGRHASVHAGPSRQ